MKCDFGYCMVCEREIAKNCSTCGVRSKTSEYTEVEIHWSNGSRMQIAVCLPCAVNHAWTTPAAKEGIKLAHWDAWEKVGGKYDKEVYVV